MHLLQEKFQVLDYQHQNHHSNKIGLPYKAQKVFDKVVEWDKKLIKKCQDKFGLTDYQVVCISFAKGFIIGALIL